MNRIKGAEKCYTRRQISALSALSLDHEHLQEVSALQLKRRDILFLSSTIHFREENEEFWHFLKTQQHQTKGMVIQRDIYRSHSYNRNFIGWLEKLFLGRLKGSTESSQRLLHKEPHQFASIGGKLEPILLLLKFLYKQQLPIYLLVFWN